MASDDGSTFGGGGPTTTGSTSNRSKPSTSSINKVTSGLGELGFDFDQVIKQNKIRIGKSFMGFSELLDYFNISKLPDYDGVPMPYIGHLIFSRPSFNVNVGMTGNRSSLDSNASANYSALQSNSITSAWVNDPYGKKILHMLSDANTSAYLPLFTNRAMSYSVQDASLKTVEKGHTYYGHYIKYGKHSEEHKIGGTISIDFRNDYYSSILKAVAIWCSYIMIVSKGDAVQPSNVYQQNGILDYAGSIYYIVTRANSTSIVYWEKLTGVFPKTVPLSMFSYNDNMWTEDKLSIEFDYAIRSDPCDPNVLFDINMLSGESRGTAEYYMQYGAGNNEGRKMGTYNSRSMLTRPDGFEGQFGRGDVYATVPVIQAGRTTDGGLQYYLQWRRK